MTDETTDAAYVPTDELPEPISRSVHETLDDFVAFRRNGRFIAK